MMPVIYCRNVPHVRSEMPVSFKNTEYYLPRWSRSACFPYNMLRMCERARLRKMGSKADMTVTNNSGKFKMKNGETEKG